MKFIFGGCELDGNVFLAPMAGVTDMAFRRICHKHGCSLSYSEMVSAKALSFDSKKTAQMMESGGLDSAVQIFGHEPDVVEKIAADASRYGLFLDINMGCPAPKIVNNNDGSALMKNLDLAREIIRAAVKGSEKPVSLKMRLGWDSDNITCFRLAQIAQEEGVFAVTLHARTREQFYSGHADWSMIKKMKDSLDIPVVGNGDIFSAEDAVRMFEQTGVDAVMIARGAQGNPWIFEEIKHLIETGEPLPKISIEERIFEAIEHITLLCELKGEHIGAREARKHAAWYTASLPGAAKARVQINAAQTLDEMKIALKSLL